MFFKGTAVLQTHTTDLSAIVQKVHQATLETVIEERSGPSLCFTWCEHGLRPKDHKVGSVNNDLRPTIQKPAAAWMAGVANTHRAFLFQLWGKEKYSTAHSKLGPLSLPGSPDQKQLCIRILIQRKGKRWVMVHSRCSWERLMLKWCFQPLTFLQILRTSPPINQKCSQTILTELLNVHKKP